MKHKKLTMIVALVLVAALAAGLGIWATGEANIPTVTYYDGSDGTNAHFTFTHTGKGSDTNLFPNFSDCMPGDSLTQTIRVQADSKNGAQGAKIYLRAEIDGDASAKEGSAISYNDVLDHISMTVSKNGVVLASNKTAKLFSQLDASEGLKSNVFIAEVQPQDFRPGRPGRDHRGRPRHGQRLPGSGCAHRVRVLRRGQRSAASAAGA